MFNASFKYVLNKVSIPFKKTRFKLWNGVIEHGLIKKHQIQGFSKVGDCIRSVGNIWEKKVEILRKCKNL